MTTTSTKPKPSPSIKMPDVAISNLTEYAEQMSKSLDEKLYCVPFLADCDVIVDLGCADGRLLTALRKRLPEPYLYGVDSNPDMLGFSQFPNAYTRCTDFNTVLRDVQHAKRPGLILSSVLHEIYHQQSRRNPALIDQLWKQIAESFYVVCIRDMCIDRRLYHQPAPPDAVRRLKELFPAYVADYCGHWDMRPTQLWQESDLLHFLLKYRYTANWEREVREDYFGLTYDELMFRKGRFLRTGFFVKHLRHYAHPFTVEQVNRDTGIQIAHKTHVECVLSRR